MTSVDNEISYVMSRQFQDYMNREAVWKEIRVIEKEKEELHKDSEDERSNL